jgi:hypothetical protein
MKNNFKKPDLKASRYRERRLGILNEETIKEFKERIKERNHQSTTQGGSERTHIIIRRLFYNLKQRKKDERNK